ncbi:MAG: hypothetical protein NW226_19450 [Microscillaceae bacterium]|nr:hypothetical protein [Microscillaceae bacterium]
MNKSIFPKIILFLICFSTLKAQVPSNPLGLNPLRLKWQQINTDKVQVIFPQGLEQQGQRVANTVHYLWNNQNQSIGDKPQKVSILLQNQTTIPNGFVTVGPFRSEFYTTPPQFNFNGTADWIDMLAIHEYRHVLQFSNSRKGITWLAKNTLGSWAWGGVAGTALPRWFFEGDAVVTETALSQAGRGRLPEFDMEYRSLILDNKTYNYEKASAGSLRDFVPNHYNLGYYMTAYARNHFGQEIWKNVLNDAVKYKGLFYPLSHSLNRRTGLRTPEMYRAMIKELDSTWKAQENKLTLTPFKKINTKPKKTITNYSLPQYLGAEADGIVAEKQGFDQIRTICKINPQGEEKMLFTPGNYSTRNASLSTNGALICWAEWTYHPRWGNRNYSIIKIYDLRSDTKRKLTSESRYFSPALNRAGTQIAAIEVTEDLKYSLVILSVFDGTVVQKIENPENIFLSMPRWLDDDQRVVMVAQQGESNWIQLTDTQNGQSQQLGEKTTFQLTAPFAHGAYIYFSGAYTGINNIFAVKLGESTLYQVTSVRLGAFQPSVSQDGSKLVYSDFTRMGFDLAEIEIKPETWKIYNPNQEKSSITYFEKIAAQEGGSIISKIPNEKLEVRKFKKWSGIINPHSLLPTLFPPTYGLRLLSDNKFSTFSTQLGITYNANESEFTYSADLTYAELFPVINIGYSRSNRERTFGIFDQASDTTVFLTLFNEEWVENDVYIGLELPFNLGRNSFFNRLRLNADFHVLNIETANRYRDPSIEPSLFRVNNPGSFQSSFYGPPVSDVFSAIDLRLRYGSQQAAAIQNYNPRFAHFWDIRYRKTLGNHAVEGDVFLARLDIFLPGIARNHSTQINLAYQAEEFKDNYKFRNLFFYPRGFGSVISDDIFKVGFNYGFPLIFPDIPVASFLFIKSIKANLFLDYANYTEDVFNDAGTPAKVNLSSAGLELTFDVRAFRLLEVELGARYSYKLKNPFRGEDNKFEFLLLRIGI